MLIILNALFIYYHYFYLPGANTVLMLRKVLRLDEGDRPLLGISKAVF